MCVWSTIASSPRSATQHRQEVERAVERALAQREVGLRDGRGEPLVERAGDAEPRVQAVPPGAQRQVVQAELAGVEEPEQLDVREAVGAQLAELLGPVLADVPRVPRALRPR